MRSRILHAVLGLVISVELWICSDLTNGGLFAAGWALSQLTRRGP